MKKLFLTLFILPIALHAATVTLAWDANAASELITAYKLYELQPDGTTWAVVGTTGGTQLILSGVSPGVHTYAVTATNVYGESPRSNQVQTPGAPTPPQNGRIISITVP